MDKRDGADYLEQKFTWIKVYVMVLCRLILAPALSMWEHAYRSYYICLIEFA